jgi:hypothetical protein
MVLRARFDGKVFIPEKPVALPADQLVDLDVREVESPPKGSAQAIIEMMRGLPKLQPGDAEALMKAINSAKQPADYRGCFDEEFGEGDEAAPGGE